MEQHEDATAPARVATSPQAATEYVDHEAAMSLEDDLRIAKTTSSRRPVTLHQLSFREHSEQNLTALRRFDRLCLWFLKFVVAQRALAFCLVTGFYAALAGAGIALGCLTPSPQYQYEWIIDDKRSTLNTDMRLAAVDAVDPLGAGTLHARKEQYTRHSIWVEYAGSNDHIFTPETLKHICEMEATLYRPAEYQDICVLDDDGQCVIPPLSIVGRFYGNDWLAGLVRNGTGSCYLLGTAEVEATWRSMISAANSTLAGFSENGVFMGKGAISAGVTSKTRSLLYLGQPLEGFASTTDRTERQYRTYLSYLKAVERDLWDFFGVESTFIQSAYLAPWRRDGLKFRCFSWLLARLENLRMLEMDAIFIICTIIFVSLWIQIHTGSASYTRAAMAQIQMSIPISAFFYRVVFRIDYFGSLHLCGIFLALGIGADDILVLFDAWRQAQGEVPTGEDADETMLRRIVYAFTQTIDAIFNTSLTTALAFLCLGFSPIMPVSTFGIFAAMIVICNFIMVLTMIPTCLILCDGCCFWPKRCAKKTDSNRSAPKCGRRIFPSIKPLFERFYLRSITWAPSSAKSVPIGACASICCFFALGIFLGYRAAHLDTPRGQEELFPQKHMFTGFLQDMSDDYEAGAEGEYCDVFYTFGIDNLGKQNYNEYEPDYKRGYAKWSDSFDLHVPVARTAFKSFCDAVRVVPCGERECSGGLLHMPGSTVCFYEEFESWKVIGAVWKSSMRIMLFIRDTLTNYTDDYTTHEYFFAQVAGFGNVSLDLNTATDEEFYGELTSFRETTYPGMMLGQESDGSTWKDYIGFVDGRLRYVTVPTSLTMKRFRGIQERRKVINRVIKFVDEQQPSLPPEIGHLTYDGGWQFLWADALEALRASLYEGLAICFPLAFVVLVFATGNLLVSIYAIFGIALIVASVLGTIEYIYGWDLGVIESIMGNLVIGFSVDYTIHLGHMFVVAGKEHDLWHRVDRFSFAIRKMGGTVVGGAVTTLGAGLFMLPCQLVSFYKLGLLMVTTIFFSLLYSFGFFMPLLAAAGPSGDQFAFRPVNALKRMVVKVHGIMMGDK